MVNTMWKQATVVVERSNSFNSNIDWIAHGSIDGSRPHGGNRFRFVFGHVNSVDREASIRLRMRISNIRSLTAYLLIDDSFSA